MINRLWKGEGSLGWAFWGIGFGGASFPLAVFLFWWMYLNLGYSFIFANLLFIIVGVIPTVIVWRTASKSVSTFWGKAAKGIIFLSVVSGLFILVSAPIGLIFNKFAKPLTPEFYENTTRLKDTAPAFFGEHTGLDIPEGAKVAHVVYYRRPVLDYEFGHHVILEASKVNLGGWVETAKPFGKNLEITTPVSGLEWNTDGLKCDNVKRAEAKFTIPICSLSEVPMWHIKHRIKSDRVVTMTVLEDHNLIWLYVTSW